MKVDAKPNGPKIQLKIFPFHPEESGDPKSILNIFQIENGATRIYRKHQIGRLESKKN